MLVESPSDTAGSVFFDPTSRRRRAAISVLLAALAVAAGLAGLLVIGLIGGGHPPRTSVDRRAIIGPAARHVGRSGAGHRVTGRRPSNLPPPLPTLPAN
jgi:hypothetical protein